MFLDVLPFKNDTARLVRVYGDEPCITLPEALPAPEGGTLTITELGDYCFSEKPRGLPAPEELCRYAVEPDGTARLLRAFGRDLTGASHARYDLDFGNGDASAAARSGEEALHPLCGSFLEELVLPGSLRVIGSCAFYNCRRLRRLSAGAGELTMGSDVFLNCFALETLVIRARPEQATGLFALVACITEAVQALFWPEGEARPLAGLWYPAYWEDIEETPAHILLHTFSGQGYHYRQCFLDGKFLPVEYDAIFPQGHDADDANIMAMLCFDRLRWPWSLSSAAAEHYRAFLAANTGRVLARLLKAQDMDGLRALLALDVFDPAIGKLLHFGPLMTPWLGTEMTAYAAIVIVSVWQGMGYVMVIMIAALTGISSELVEAAKIDGANAFQIFFKIKLPLCMPYITLCLFWTISQAFKMFDLNYSLTKGGPYGSTVSLALNIYNDAFANNKYGLATAESFVFFVIILVITSVQMYFSRKKEEELM